MRHKAKMKNGTKESADLRHDKVDQLGFAEMKPIDLNEKKRSGTMWPKALFLLMI